MALLKKKKKRPVKRVRVHTEWGNTQVGTSSSPLRGEERDETRSAVNQ